MQDFLSDLKSKVDFIESTLASCITDLEFNKKTNKLPLYNIDFSIICPLLFSKPVEGSKEYLLSAKNLVSRLFDGEDTNNLFHITISGATFFEFLDQLEHIRYCIENKLPKIIELNTSKIINENILMESDSIRDSLSILAEKGYAERIVKPIKNMKQMVEGQKLCGLGDFLDPPSKKRITETKYIYEKILQQNKKVRLNRDLSKRSYDDNMFHYVMDAINVWLSILYSQEPNAACVPLFTTPSGLNIQKCESNGVRYGRNPAVPLFIKNAKWLQNNNFIPDMEEYFEDSMRSVVVLKKKINNSVDIHNDRYLKNRIADFCKTYAFPLYKAKVEECNVSDAFINEDFIEEIKSVVADPKKTKNIAENAILQLKENTQELNDLSYLLDISYFEAVNLDHDPIVSRIRSNLGI
jgi:hypothetical protein